MDSTEETHAEPQLSIKTSRRSHSPMASAPSPSCFAPTLTAMGDDHITFLLQFLPFESILSFSATCRRFRSIAAAESLWESVCRRDWGSGQVDALIASLSAHESREMCWKRLYRRVFELGSLSCYRLSSRDGGFPRPRASHSLNFVSDCLVLFGGGCEGGRHLDDTWVADFGNGFNKVLSWQQVSLGAPSGRFGQSCTVSADSLVLFGGINDNGVRQNDTWTGSVVREGSLRTEISWALLDAGSTAPSPRGAHASCHAGHGRVLIHGGIGLNGHRLNDMWLLDLSCGPRSARWRQVPSGKPSPSPPSRSGHSLTWIGGDRMVLFGGRGSGYEVLNDVWLLDMGGRFPEWEELKYDDDSSDEVPRPRAGHSATLVLGGRVLIYGGEDAQRRRKDDLWVLEPRKPSRRMWKKLRVEGHSPSYRSFHGACADRSGRCVFVFGGMVDAAGVLPGDAFDGLRFDGGLYLMQLVL